MNNAIAHLRSERGFLAADPNGITLYFGHALESALPAQ